MKTDNARIISREEHAFQWRHFLVGLLLAAITVSLWVWAKPIVSVLKNGIGFGIAILLIFAAFAFYSSFRKGTAKHFDIFLWIFISILTFAIEQVIILTAYARYDNPLFNPYIFGFIFNMTVILLFARGIIGHRDFCYSFRYFLLFMLALIFLIPFYWMLTNSLKTFQEIFSKPTFLPPSWKWSNYPEVFKNPQLPFARYFFNTFLIAAIATFGQILSCSIVAYAFARLRFRGREFLFMVVLATMMVPFQVTMIPLYIGFRFLNEHHFLGLRWLNSMLPIVVPQLCATAFNVFLLRQFYRTIPYELDEAAHIDGCSKFGIFWRVILPLSKPALIIVGLFTFFWNWKDLMGPLVYLNSPENTTISMGLMFLKNPKHIDWQLIMAASTISLIPVLILFFIGQKYIVRGITMTGMKA
jgi:multiple sugar transport system permease protein